MRIVITGGNGFVGQHLQRELIQNWPDVELFVWDLPEVDITDPATYQDQLAARQPDWIVHVAALAAVGPSAAEAKKYMSVNAGGTERLLATMAADSPRTRALVVSSADVYGLTPAARSGQPVPELPLEECRPANPYAESKLAMERIVVERFADRVVRVRPFPHIGPGQKKNFVTADFAAQIAKIEKSAAPREASRGARRSGVMRVGNLTSARDFTDVRDVVRAYRLLMEQKLTGEVFNVASGRAVSIQDIVDRLVAVSSAEITVEQDPARVRPVDVPILVGDASRLQTATGWTPEIPLEQSLRDIMAWWRDQEELPG